MHPGAPNRRLALLAVLFVAALLSTGSAVPWFDNSLEYKVKAAFLYNFARYVTWPEQAFDDQDDELAPLVVGVLGEDPFGPILDATLKGKTVGGREVELRRFDSIKAAATAHLLFVSHSEQQHLKLIRPALKKSHTFCVSEIDDYATTGGVARFYFRLGRTAFEINKDEAERRGLSVSSQLLKLATVVQAEQPEEDD
ncbi:MAG: YfiR family protein [Planctomycetota bacterium]|nr:MAG: YfiR family protein [Planctomycetota bacterium]